MYLNVHNCTSIPSIPSTDSANAVQLIGAMVVTAVARLYASTMGNQRPYVYLLVGRYV
jgi:hypothetical protein